MLNRIEHRIMEHVFTRCRGKRTILFNPTDILADIGVDKDGNPVHRFEITEKQLDVHMKNILLDGYIEYSQTEKNGNNIYVVTLTSRGEAFQREIDERRKRRIIELGWRVVYAGIAFIVAFVLGKAFG